MYAKAHLPKLLVQHPAFETGDYSKALIESFYSIDELLASTEGKIEIEKIASEIKKDNSAISRDGLNDIAFESGCTACVVLITKAKIYVANCGDSRCVLSKSGMAIPLSSDHKPELKEEIDRIIAAGGFIKDGRINGILNLSRTLGDLDLKGNPKLTPDKQIIIAKPDIKEYEIKRDSEFLVIASDGVWECMLNERTITYFRNKIWDTNKNVPKRIELSKVIGEALDSIMDMTANNEGNIYLINRWNWI